METTTRIVVPFCFAALALPASAQVAVTEFLNNPDGADMGREWAELFNFGQTGIDLQGWVLADEGGDAFSLPSLTLAPGEYLILVFGGVGGVDGPTAKAIFETEWLGGAPSTAVVGMPGVSLSNTADEIVLLDAAEAVVWSLAYGDDETSPLATFLTATTDFSVSVFGSAEDPGVVRDGDDNGVAGFAGYEQNDATPDPFAVASDISSLAVLFGEAFASVAEPSVGSPLAGGYQPLPPGDQDHDGTVGETDLLLLLGAWGPCPAPPASCPADLDGDATVGVIDFLLLLANWT